MLYEKLRVWEAKQVENVVVPIVVVNCLSAVKKTVLSWFINDHGSDTVILKKLSVVYNFFLPRVYYSRFIDIVLDKQVLRFGKEPQIAILETNLIVMIIRWQLFELHFFHSERLMKSNLNLV